MNPKQPKPELLTASMVWLPVPIQKQVMDYAKKEDRKFSPMARVLIQEALKARELKVPK